MKMKNLKYCIDKLDIQKLSKLNFSLIKNYDVGYQIHHSPGAMEMMTIVVSVKLFDSIWEFLTHVLALRYARYVSFDLPSNFLEEDIEIVEFDVNEFKKYLFGYIESYMDLTDNFIWKIQLNVDNYIIGYRISPERTGLFLICETSEFYIAYFYTSID